MAAKKYMSYDGLAEYDSLIKGEIANNCETTLSSAKLYTDEQLSGAFASMPQPDWNQSDETASDYIKNRPFYIEQGEENIIFEETTVSTSESSVRDGYYTALLNEDPIGLELNKTYYVLLNGIEYECVCYEDKANGFLSLGNEWIPLYDPEPEDSGEPFYIHDAMDTEPYVTMYTSISGDITIKITEKSVTIHKIPADFLYTPDWNQNDESAPDYIKNRPFYVAAPIETINISGILEPDEEGYSGFYYNEDLYISIEPEYKYTMIFDGITYECNLVLYGDGNVYIGNPAIIYEGDDNGIPFCVTSSYIYQDGFNILLADDDLSTHTFNFIQIYEEVKIIDKKYLPETVGIKSEGQTYTVWDLELDEEVEMTAEQGAESFNCAIAIGMDSHAEGNDSQAVGNFSHAEGDSCYAWGDVSHAEGYITRAFGWGSHAEGYCTEANGQYSHTEGYYTKANGDYSHVEGEYTIAASNYQHVQGIANIEDTEGKYIHIVGNGEHSFARSNAHTLDWDGNAWFAGTIKIGGTGQDDEAAVEIVTKNDVYTKAEVDALIAEVMDSITKIQMVTWEAND